jgi:hypothetical protein
MVVSQGNPNKPVSHKTVLVGAQVTPEFADSLVRIADLAGVPKSELIRRALERSLPKFASGEWAVVGIEQKEAS